MFSGRVGHWGIRVGQVGHINVDTGTVGAESPFIKKILCSDSKMSSVRQAKST